MNERGKIDLEVVKILGEGILRRFAFCGSKEHLREYMKKVDEMGVSSVVFGPPQGIRKKGVEILVDAKSGV